MLAFTLPFMLSGTGSAGSEHLSLPTLAGIRSSVAQLLAWVADNHTPTPLTPRQQSGTAAGLSHEVPASATRGDKHATGRTAGKGAGQMPAYTVHLPKAHQDTTGWIDPGNASSFSPRTSTPVPSGATATSDLYRNLDGSYTRLEFASPVNYQAASGAWKPIDTDLVAGTAGRWAVKASPVTVSFAADASSPSLATVSGGQGTSPFGIGIGVSGAARTTGTVVGPAVAYAGILPDTSLTQKSTATGVTESFTLAGPSASGGWNLPLTLTGLKPAAEADGAIDFLSPAGTAELVIPAVAGLDYQLSTVQGKPDLTVTVNQQWLAASGQSFPVTIGFSVTTPAGALATVTPTATSELDFTGPPAVGVHGTRLKSVSLHVLERCPAGSVGENIGVALADGPQLGSQAAVAACGASGSGTWMSVPATAAGVKALASRSGTSGDRLEVTSAPAKHLSPDASSLAVTSGSSAVASGEVPASAGTAAGQAAAVLVMTAATTETPPQINSQYPSNNYNEPTLTPELMATGQDNNGNTDAPEFEFQVYNSSGTKLADSGLVAAAGQISPSGTTNPTVSGDWVVPSGDLAWGQTYYWVVQDYDGTDYSAAPSPTYFSTPVPQPLITSGLSQNDDPGFSTTNGNYTTSATDASVSVVGPALAIERDYNSLDPRTSGAFGAGWSSELDMKVSPGQTSGSGSTATEVVTYPDGSQVAFGLNSSGTSYTSAEGRFATFAAVSSGGFTLTDKNDTVYTFTESLPNSVWGITSITDALGHPLDFTWSGSEITTITSAKSDRSLHLTWSQPSGASYPHVATVYTDPVSGTDQDTDITWTYNYSEDQLSSACLSSDAADPCTSYNYQTGSDYPGAVLDSGPQSYWRLDDPSGSTTAANSVLLDEGADNATYSNVTLGQDDGPLAGNVANAATFNGTSSVVTLPDSLVSGATYESVSVWFKTTSTSQVLFSYQLDPLSAGTTTAHYTPSLYVGSDGYLHGEFWTNTVEPMSSGIKVNDGAWHLATLTASGNTQTLYVDGQPTPHPITGKAIEVNPQLNDYIGAGFLGGTWPDEADENKDGNDGYATYFKGDISDFGFWTRPLTGAEITAMYAAGHGPASLLTKVTRPSGNTYQSVSYNSANGTVNQLTDSNGGTWKLGTPTVTGTSQVYVGSVLGNQPSDYWRLNDTGTTNAVNQVNGGTAAYNDVTQGVTGGPFSDSDVDSFNGSASYIGLPNQLSNPGASESIGLWFKTSADNGILVGNATSPLSQGTITSGYHPALYVGADGKLLAEFFGASGPITSSASVANGKWHFAVLAASGTSQSLYLDGALVGTISATLSPGSGTWYDWVGAGFIGGAWPDESHGGQSAAATYFNGDIAEVGYYPSQLSAAQVTAEYDASQSSGGVSPVETATVTDPGLKTLTYTYDPTNGYRELSETNGLGQTTKYGYDVDGFQDEVVDPDGDVTDTGYDVRGNMVSKTTCQDQATQQCSTSYYSYYPDDTTSQLSSDPRNDVMLTSRDPRSASSKDNTYLTSYNYNSLGELTSETTPPVSGFPSGETTTYLYTDGKTDTGGYEGAVPPAGLEYQETTPGGATTTTLYYGNGDVAQVTNPDNLQTTYTYDGVGRETQQTVVSDSYPNGLSTTYQYDPEGQVTTETDPPVTDQVTGAIHTAQTSTTYDLDGDVLSQTVSDTSGGDAPRTVSYTYNSNDLESSSTDADKQVTDYTYDPYGDLATETDPQGNETDYAYDPDGRLLSTTLKNYTGTPSGSQQATALPEETRAYDPAGRLASVTDAMGNTTCYAYTDNGLLSSVTRVSSAVTVSPCTSTSIPAGDEYSEESDTYDAAGNMISQVTNNGATTTDYSVDANDQNTSETLDPNGLDRVTAYAYTADGYVSTESVSQGPTGSWAQATSWTYDPMGNPYTESVYDPGAGGPSGYWKLNQASGTTVSDSSGNGNQAVANGGVTWSGGAAQMTGTWGQDIATNGPVLNTASSFSVAAWVNLAGDTNQDQTVVSQDAGTADGFALKYWGSSGGWQFMRPNSDTSDPSNDNANSSASASTGTWTFLVGTYNADYGTMTLYVNGAQSGSSADYSPIESDGPLRIGASKWGGNLGSWLDGSVSGVQVYPTDLSASQVSSLYQDGQNGGTLTTNELTTQWTLDERGLPTAETDPDGYVKDYLYDEAGRLAVTYGDAVDEETDGGTPVSSYAVTKTGYDTFGDVAETDDADGNITTYGYDADGRQTLETDPSYTQPSTGDVITPQSSQVYNSLGEVTSATDPDGNKTTSTYDQLGDLTSQQAPDGGVTNYTYDLDGDQLSEAGPTGSVTDATYDYLGRKLTSTQVETIPSAAAYTTTYSYAPTTADPSGAWLSSDTSPDGMVTQYGYDAAGEETSATNGAGDTTSYQYDPAGRQTAVVNPDGTEDTTSYDTAGNVTGTSSLSSVTNGTVLASQSAIYDEDGNMLSSTDALGNTTSFTYDETGNVTSEVQPVSATSAITTSFGYDAAGKQTRYTDGNGNNWITEYNSMGLPETVIEPSTSQYSGADSTFTTSYDADGNPVSEQEPGGVTLTDGYDNMGDLTSQSGTGATGATATRAFTYDDEGNMLSASTTNTAPSGSPSNATSESFSYDDRGLLTSASGTAGTTGITYNGDGLATAVNDAAGTTSYTYDNDDRLSTLSDPLSGTTQTYSYNPMSQVSKVQYGTAGSGDVQSFGYNGLHEMTSDSLDTASGSVLASVGYGYDADGDLTSMNTTGLAGASSNAYTYDDAGRLTSWANGSTTTNYGYDANGNMTQDGSKTYSYDARDELTSDGTNTYSYTANGTLQSEQTSTGTVNSEFDAFGDQVQSGTQSYSYDGLGRDVSDTGNGQSWTFSYDGLSSALASDGVSDYTWDPSGTSLIGIGSAGGSGGSGVLALEDQHGNVVGNFTASAASLAGSQGYDPWGDVTGTTGTPTGQLGYQSGWTDPVTQKVEMGSRWYTPSTGDFTSRDTASNSPLPNSASANPFAYVADNPLGATDPSGHYLIDDSADGTYVRPAPSPPPTPVSSCSGWGWFSCSYSSVVHTVQHVVHRVAHAIKRVVKAVKKVIKAVKKVIKKVAPRALRDVAEAVVDASAYGAAAMATYDDIGSVTSRAFHAVTHYVAKKVDAVKHLVATAYHEVKRVATATVHFVQHHAAAIAAIVVSVAVMAGCEATLGAVTAGAATPVCGALSGAAGNAASYAVTAAETHKFSWSALGETTAEGAVAGLVGDGIGEIAGAASGLLSSGADAAASAVTDGASGEVTEAAEAAEGTAGESATEAQDDADPSCEVPSGDEEGGESFSASTRVLLASGKAVPISDLKVGDKVKAVNTKTGKAQVKTVEAVLVHYDTDLYDLTVKTAHGTEVIDTTSNHLFWDPYLHHWVSANKLTKGEHLKSPDGTTVTVVGGAVPAGRDGWMWDLTVQDDHDFYALPSVGSQASTKEEAYVDAGEPVLVHNDSCPDIAAAARAAARRAPDDATMTSVARIKGTDTGEIGYSGASSRPSYLEPEIEEAAQDGGQMFGGDAANCAEMRACNALFANHAADFEEETGRPLEFSDIEFLTVRSATGAPEAACLSCQSALVRRGATDLSVGG
ncbi:MAG TPA: LamG-like jellyroll fold domain-containing protein [Trebonia sp.]|nr:LamG-like jellyroll fold domain-containing protein [Trebonia sp.]